MRHFFRARNQVNSQFTRASEACSPPNCAQMRRTSPLRAWRHFVHAGTALLAISLPAFAQDTGSKEKEFFGNGAEIAVIVHDGSGQLISTPAMVRLYRDGSIPNGQGATSQGRLSFIVTSFGEFTLLVEAAGYAPVQRVVSVTAAVRVPVEVSLRPLPAAAGMNAGDGPSVSNGAAGTTTKPILAPKAKEAFDRGLQALSADKLREAEKYVGEAARLAPGHPDVLYAQGVLYLRLRDFSQAQSALEKATQIDPHHGRAFAALGMALADQRKYVAAIAPLETSLRLDGGAGWEARFVLASAEYRCERYEEALANAQAALRDSHGKAPEIMLLVAQSLTAVGKYDDAANVLRAFLHEHGDRPEAAKARRWLADLEERKWARTPGK
jgi:Flp pilus assembly protein TadD